MKFSLDTIRSRVSTRSFDGTPLNAAERDAMEKSFTECLPCPFGNAPRFMLVKAEPGSGTAKMGTYGLVSKVPAYVVGTVALAPMAMEDFGYAMEGIALRATELGLGSCWLGGVFDRGKAGRALAIRQGEVVPAVLALGRPATARTVQDQIVYKAAGSRRRKDGTELFFEQGPGEEIRPLADAGEWMEILEAVRIAPSASNKQPWRLLLDSVAGSLHLYLDEDRIYNAMLKPVRLQNMDMGIALRHIEAASGALGADGAIRRIEDKIAAPLSGGYRYIASWIRR